MPGPFPPLSGYVYNHPVSATLAPTRTMTTASKPHAVVIGSGFGGLAAAIRLGARGYQVTEL